MFSTPNERCLQKKRPSDLFFRPSHFSVTTLFLHVSWHRAGPQIWRYWIVLLSHCAVPIINKSHNHKQSLDRYNVLWPWIRTAFICVIYKYIVQWWRWVVVALRNNRVDFVNKRVLLSIRRRYHQLSIKCPHWVVLCDASNLERRLTARFVSKNYICAVVY